MRWWSPGELELEQEGRESESVRERLWGKRGGGGDQRERGGEDEEEENKE